MPPIPHRCCSTRATATALRVQVRAAMEMPIVELIPELVHRVKKLINCDRASVFIRSEDGADLTTILAEGSEQITIPCDVHSIAGAATPHTSLGDTWHALLTIPPLVTRGMPSSPYRPW